MPNKTPKSEWVKPITFPDALPISQRRDEIARAIQEHQVVILAGETGSGKTTQLPKICLSLGYGTQGLIGHTQPRRIAARTVADRIASELNSKLGETVGYQVRFSDVSGPETRIKLMTDGVLLAELQRDRLLRRYEVIIIDEAHERSLNIDFLLGLLKPLCKRRPELKIIITSATIDLQKFAQHFSHEGSPAPIIEVSGRTYPVSTHYHPLDNNESLPEVIADKVKELIRAEAKGETSTSGDMLVFCAGEREIRDAADAIRRANLPVATLPLYSKLSIAEQNKVFAANSQRKIVLATNVAETSLTVPGIAYVIDPGLARISRYSFKSKVQRLPIEAISQASANQRMGRCGRVSNGVCIRLYSEEDFDSRAEFTQAEILRSNLASVILRMLRLGLKDIDKFDFLDQPDKRLLNDGFKLLQELNAIAKNGKLSEIGKQMSELAIDPKFARILIAANELGCLRDALVVISALSIRDPRERPADKQSAADQAHSWLQHPQSDFFSYLNLWQAINNFRSELSNSKFKQLCLQRYWSIARVFEWRELYRQLAQQGRELGWKTEEWRELSLPIEGEKRAKPKGLDNSERYAALHSALISGLLGNLANKDMQDGYIATRGRSTSLFPSSALGKQKPKWLVAAEFIETTKLYMHTAAEIKPEWVIKVANHLCKYSYSEPRYQSRTGAIRANRKTLFYGLVLRDKEAVNYGPINPREARGVFIQQALVEAAYQPASSKSVIAQNYALIRNIEKLETKTRRRNLLLHDNALMRFYDERLATHICSNKSLEKWLASPGNAALITLKRDQAIASPINSEELAQFPDSISVLNKTIKLVYRFNPGQAHDGVTMQIPISVLAPFPLHIGDWLVPGLLREKCIALIKTLPKTVRRNFAPAANAVDRVINQLDSTTRPLHEVLADQLFKSKGVKVDPEQFALEKLDLFYRMNYRIIDVDGSLVEESRDLGALKASYADAVAESVHADRAPGRLALEKHQLSDWDFGPLAPSVEFEHAGMTVRAYPMLKVMPDNSVSLTVSETPEMAGYESQQGVLALARIVLGNQAGNKSENYLKKELFKKTQSKPSGLSALASKLNSASIKPSDRTEWLEPTILAALQIACFSSNIGAIKDRAAFSEAIKTGSKKWVSTALELEGSLEAALSLRDQLLAKINQVSINTIEQDSSLEDIKSQIYRLFERQFLRYTTLSELKQYPRYLRAVEFRIEQVIQGKTGGKDEKALLKFQAGFDQWLDSRQQSLAYHYLNTPELKQFATQLQEWRVSIYAQQLRTQQPVSEKRLAKAWQAIIQAQS